MEIYNIFQWASDDDNENKVDKTMEKFERYCNLRENLTFERHSFFSGNQFDGKLLDAYVTDLRNKAARCEFIDLKDRLICDRIVCVINDDTVRARLLREAELTLEGCIGICQGANQKAFVLCVAVKKGQSGVIKTSYTREQNLGKKDLLSQDIKTVQCRYKVICEIQNVFTPKRTA